MKAILNDSLDGVDLAPNIRERLSRTRVAFVTDVPTPYVIALLRALSHKVDLTALFSSDVSTRGLPWQFGDLGFAHAIVRGSIIRRSDAGGTDYYISPRLLRHLARRRPEIVICAGFSFPTLYAQLYCAVTGARLLIYSDGTSFSERNYSRWQLLARRYLIARTSGLIAKSRLAAERFVELGGAGRITIAHHTTDLAPFLEIGAQRATDADAAATLRLLSVGRLIARKGLNRLLDAMRLLPKTSRPVHLTIVGSGPDEESLRALVQSHKLTNVTFAGFVDQSALPPFYRQADVFVLPTLQDPFGIVMLEAAASGLALLGSIHSGATPELVKPEITGFSFDPARPEILAAQISRLADEPSTVLAMGKAAHHAALQRVPEKSADGYLAAMAGALSPRAV